jgi:hypothetical protein
MFTEDIGAGSGIAGRITYGIKFLSDLFREHTKKGGKNCSTWMLR